ncbi:MAG: NAD-glutamate dehydrogenase [Gammaproteobacteria bacterium]|nr:NAD-glutamate dehydrogenase [Gammaproteobacteria bacterium]
MDAKASHELEHLLESVARAAAARVDPAQRERLHAFARAYLEMASPESLRLRSPEQLTEIVVGNFEFAQRRPPAQALVRVLAPPSRDDGHQLAVVQTCAVDRPFLVDSLLMTVRDAGGAVDWMLHPVIRLGRDADGAIAAIGSGESESLVHLEFEAAAGADICAGLAGQVRAMLADLSAVVADHRGMRSRVREVIDELERVPPGADAAEFAEAREFLRWLDDDHFTFLGAIESHAEAGAGRRISLRTVPASGLGLLRPNGRYDNEELMAPQAELDKYADSPRVVVVTKAAQRSPIHHPEYMDVISVKRFDASGNTLGTLRLLGLFSTAVYIERPSAIPLIRRKYDYVLRRSRLPADSHSGKHLRDILHQLPRDELFQSSEDELYRTCMGIRALRDRQQLKLFMRRDRYGRFYSCMVYLPRERFSRELRDKLEQELLAICHGLGADRRVDFLRNNQTRIHFIVRTPPGTQIDEPVPAIEQRLIAATRSWREHLRERLRQDYPPAEAERFAQAFPLSYAEEVDAAEAASDVAWLRRLSVQEPLLPRLILSADEGAPRPVQLKLYAWERPLDLSDALPVLGHFGLRVTRQEPADLTPQGGPTLWIQRFDIAAAPAPDLAASVQRENFENAFMAVWNRRVEDDGLNRLVLEAGLTVRQVTLLRAILKYLIQTGLPFGQLYMERLLGEHAMLARLLVDLFEARFDPQRSDADRRRLVLERSQALDQQLDGVASLDADRALRAFLAVVRACLRTNYFQRDGDKPYLSFKLDSSRVPELPLPRPMYEIWVYSPQVEGIHLRGGKVARGGLRWSDRRQDFRTEVLGLMKAQMVKNAVIVPVGAKGGFVVKRAVDPADREAWLAAGIDCYRIFLRGLLDITDNRRGDEILPPPETVRYDDDDPYLVVAADKGTAAFSDIANDVAAEYGFWLGDAFASGGSAGYDHKKMGITARGAWESVKLHFRELGRDIQNQPLTVAGIGDMSGDVFGNGMLLSRQIRLVAAFDHRHIFIDPEPDPERSWSERLRLFELPRSSWADYDRALISAGGGVWPRSAKSIALSEQVRAALGVDAQRLSPPELIKAILRAPVDLLWNGGIGTYVKAHIQSNEEVGDRSNDGLRVNARELRCKVVGEGGNLGFTQAARIEYALAGGRINTDAIDNAGGVHTSDREVNIKIPLNELMAAGRLSREQRDPLLAGFTDDVARAVLYDNRVQSAAISLLEHNAALRLEDHIECMKLIEREGLLNRTLEVLPDDDALKERRARGLGLMRPEIAVLIAYAKISLYQATLASPVPDDPFFERDLLAYFPRPLVERFEPALSGHRLRRELVATILSNAVVNRMGLAFAHLQADDHGLTRAEVLKAYATAHQIFDGDKYWRAIEALDNQLPAQLQYRLMNYAIGLLKHVTGWFANSPWAQRPIRDAVERFTGPVAQIAATLPAALPPAYREDWQRVVDQLCGGDVPERLAVCLANMRALGGATDIAELAEAAGVPLAEAAAVYYLCGERFRMLWLYAAINDLPTAGKWQALARVNLRDDAYRIHRQLVGRVLCHSGATPQERLEHWVTTNRAGVGLAERRLAEVQAAGNWDFSALAVAVREVRKLRML